MTFGYVKKFEHVQKVINLILKGRMCIHNDDVDGGDVHGSGNADDGGDFFS